MAPRGASGQRRLVTTEMTGTIGGGVRTIVTVAVPRREGPSS